MDLYHCRLPPHDHESVRWAVAMHAMSHVFRTRQRVLKDNERLARAAASAQETDADVDELPELRDQGFTRPKMLVLVPFRNAGKAWVDKLVALSACEQVEQKARFTREFTLPEGVLDKLADPSAAQRYPEDHRHTFAGNIDDNFKLGIKVTRKTLKLYGAFFESDVVLASPLGLRLLIEKEKEADYLSSIEVVIADQMDVMLMQNWEHVKVRTPRRLPKLTCSLCWSTLARSRARRTTRTSPASSPGTSTARRASCGRACCSRRSTRPSSATCMAR